MKVAIGQFGAPTTVLNSSLYGALCELVEAGAEVDGVVGGVHGLVAGTFIRLAGTDEFRWLRDTPGAALHAGRYADYELAVERSLKSLERQGIDALIVMGGNGTMGFAAALQAAAQAKGCSLRVVGVPKTIDNDIVGIDHSPGFPSAAQFVIQAVRDLQLDLEAMVGFEQVRIVEVMGRRCGWLAASTAFLSTVSAPIILVPEQPFTMAAVLQTIKQRVDDQGHAMVVVSEGVRDDTGGHILQVGDHARQAAKSMFGGIGAVITQAVRAHLGYGSRYENLGLLQRCWHDCSLQNDKAEAQQLGKLAARVLLDGQSGVMVGLIRSGGDDGCLVEALFPLQKVAGMDRLLTEPELSLGDAFIRWLTPLIDVHSLGQHHRLTLFRNISNQG